MFARPLRVRHIHHSGRHVGANLCVRPAPTGSPGSSGWPRWPGLPHPSFGQTLFGQTRRSAPTGSPGLYGFVTSIIRADVGANLCVRPAPTGSPGSSGWPRWPGLPHPSFGQTLFGQTRRSAPTGSPGLYGFVTSIIRADVGANLCVRPAPTGSPGSSGWPRWPGLPHPSFGQTLFGQTRRSAPTGSPGSSGWPRWPGLPHPSFGQTLFGQT